MHPIYEACLFFVSTHIKVSINFVGNLAQEVCVPQTPSKPSGGSVPLSEQLQRGDLMAAACPSREVLKHVTSRWGVLVLIALETRTHRFSELRRAIGGVSER